MYLFTIKKHLSIHDTNPEMAILPEFNAILEHKKGGEIMLKILAFYIDWSSPFRYHRNDENRLQAVLKNLTKKTTHPFCKTDEWNEAVKLYIFLQKDADRIMLRNLETYYDYLTAQISNFSSQKGADLEVEIENISRVQAYTTKAMSLRASIRDLRNNISTTSGDIEASIKKQLGFLERRHLRDRQLEKDL
jgi:flagellin-specific chaperone FliS